MQIQNNLPGNTSLVLVEKMLLNPTVWQLLNTVWLMKIVFNLFKQLLQLDYTLFGVLHTIFTVINCVLFYISFTLLNPRDENKNNIVHIKLIAHWTINFLFVTRVCDLIVSIIHLIIEIFSNTVRNLQLTFTSE